ncbi:DNA excision repair protein ERCC-1 [Babesia microti strain RI]|uniref:DNA excision repair protein ERCC-1 n=1 Tax=Babesia microti (strain RI) TaxID=1133968 RepID=A0A1R4AAR8_BABMR|nr:DNA excision repair protein ERCC-1 [Babesia microti strain RI]SJK86091.1 DNA excision repair protein ERCC-1 [Babesia microti strain RI]|eukprot:XP_021338287.1 DNA excision repair protein ERCC-1 [Babesia microti strain RI]
MDDNLVISHKQKDNPLINHLRHVPYEFGEVKADFCIGQSIGILFISQKFHRLSPNYLPNRICSFKDKFSKKFIICQVDLQDPFPVLESIQLLAIKSHITLLLSWSPAESAKLIEICRIYVLKPSTYINPSPSTIYESVIEALTKSCKISTSNAKMLMERFNTLHGIMNATYDELRKCPGIGDKKAEFIVNAFNSPFKLSESDTVVD